MRRGAMHVGVDEDGRKYFGVLICDAGLHGQSLGNSLQITTTESFHG